MEITLDTGMGAFDGFRRLDDDPIPSMTNTHQIAKGEDRWFEQVPVGPRIHTMRCYLKQLVF